MCFCFGFCVCCFCEREVDERLVIKDEIEKVIEGEYFCFGCLDWSSWLGVVFEGIWK